MSILLHKNPGQHRFETRHWVRRMLQETGPDRMAHRGMILARPISSCTNPAPATGLLDPRGYEMWHHEEAIYMRNDRDGREPWLLRGSYRA
jgi:hypothetical protein